MLDTAIRHQVHLERVGSEVTERVRKEAAKMPERAARWVQRLDTELVGMGPDELQSLLASSQEEQVQILLRAVDTLTTDLATLAAYEGEFTAKALSAQAKQGIKIMALRAGEAYAEALRQPIPATGELLEAFTQGWARKETKAVNDLIARGSVNGWTNDQVVQAIRGTKANGYRDGISARVGQNAEAVVRTSIQHVANTARRETWARNADIIEWEVVVATLDGSTTPQCRGLDGQKFRLGKAPRFPIHVRCRTTTVVELGEKWAFLEQGATRASMDGPVDAKLSYYEWLKQQPAAFQVDTIGPTRAKLLRDGGLTGEEFARLNLGRNFQPLTLEQMRKREPQAFERAGV